MRSQPQPALPNKFYAAYLFDLDGTVYLGEELLPGARRLIQELRSRNLPIRYLTNNPTNDPSDYAAKLGKLGLPTPVSEIISTVVTMTRWLLDNAPDAVVYPICEAPLLRALTAAGIKVSSNPAEIDIVIASYDRTFTYDKLQIAFDALWFHRRARLVTTNLDRFCPFPGGRGEPDAAAIVAAVEACTGMQCSVNVGKPDPMMLRAALQGLDVAPGQCVMVGDRLTTDVQMALDTGVTAALVLSGATAASELRLLAAAQRPEFVLDRVDQLLPPAAWAELGWT